MSELLTAENYPVWNILQQTVLNADANSGQATVVVQAPDGASPNGYALLGTKGKDTSQLLQIQSVTGTSIVFTGNLNLKHYKNEPLIFLNANQIRFYRAANVDGSQPADGAFSAIATVTLAEDQLFTQTTDGSGGNGFWYKYTFFNSQTAAESSLSDALALRGGGFGHYATVDDVRREAGFQNNPWVTDQFIFQKLISAESEVNASLMTGNYALPLLTTPDEVFNATILLAAGYLLLAEYGPEHTGTNKEGNQKILQAKGLLAKFESGKLQLVDNATKQPISKANSIQGYPDDGAVSNTPSEGPMFTATDIY